MAGSFATINVSKTAVRTRITPMLLSDINTLVAEIKGVTNPFACSSYIPPGGETLDNVRTTSERYGATIQYEAAEVSIVGTVGVHAEKHTGFPTHVPVSSLILILSGQMGGDALRAMRRMTPSRSGSSVTTRRLTRSTLSPSSGNGSRSPGTRSTRSSPG